MDGRPEPPPGDARQHRVAPPAMQKRHGVGQHCAAPRRQAAALDQVKPGPQLVHKLGNLQKVIAAVGIAHNDKPAPRGGNASHQGTAITLLANLDDTRAQPGRNQLRAVGAAIIGDNDLTHNLMLVQGLPGGLDTPGQGLGFVEAGHHNG